MGTAERAGADLSCLLKDAHPRSRWAIGGTGTRLPTPFDGFLATSDSVAAAVVSHEGTLLEVNGACGRLLGRPEKLTDAVVSEHRSVVLELVGAAGNSWHSQQATFIDPSMEMVDCQVFVMTSGDSVLVLVEPMRAPAVKLNALLLDLNGDLLKARRELAVANRRLRELDDLKNMFLASATHDLKTPLTSILGYAEILGDAGLSPEAQRMALTIETSAQRLLAMVHDLLGAAQIMTGELKLERSRINLVAVIRKARETVEPTARARGVTVSVNGPEKVEAFVDERRVLQILDNLLSNAIKYSHHGGHVDVTCESRGSSLAVAVHDTGIGIPVGEQRQLFGKYFRASTALASGIEGTGLGLANARAFAEAHGGSLDCTSQPGVGSTFTLVLGPDAVVG